MHRPYAHPQIDFDTFDTLYRIYWPPVVRFCATWLATCPDGTAEEVAQDVFLAAHRALAEQRYRGEGSLSAWLFGIARNLCCKVARDLSRQTTPLVLRHLEREMARLEHDMVQLMGTPQPPAREQVQDLQERLARAHDWLERERERLQQHVREAVHCEPPVPPDDHRHTAEPCTVMHDSMQRLARRDRQAYTLLHMHVLKGASVRELAELQGMSRSAVARHLTRAKATLWTVYDATMSARQGVQASQGG